MRTYLLLKCCQSKQTIYLQNYLKVEFLTAFELNDLALKVDKTLDLTCKCDVVLIFWFEFPVVNLTNILHAASKLLKTALLSFNL